MKKQIFKSFVLVMIFITSLATSFADNQAAVAKDEQLLIVKKQIDSLVSTFYGEIKFEQMEQLLRLVDRYDYRQFELENENRRLGSICYLNQSIIDACVLYKDGHYDQIVISSLEAVSGNKISGIEPYTSTTEVCLRYGIFVVLLIAMFIFFVIRPGRLVSNQKVFMHKKLWR